MLYIKHFNPTFVYSWLSHTVKDVIVCNHLDKRLIYSFYDALIVKWSVLTISNICVEKSDIFLLLIPTSFC